MGKGIRRCDRHHLFDDQVAPVILDLLLVLALHYFFLKQLPYELVFDSRDFLRIEFHEVYPRIQRLLNLEINVVHLRRCLLLEFQVLARHIFAHHV